MTSFWNKLKILWKNTRSELAACEIITEASKLNKSDLKEITEYFIELSKSKK